MTELNPDEQRQFAKDVVVRLRDHHYQAYWAGGCVRDQLLGRAPKDYDVATGARPDDIRAIFGKRRTIPIGAAFGVITVLGPTKSAGQIEVATFRQDSTYSDGRHPDAVRFSSPEEDALRRDFTINGLFYDPISSKVIDFVEGLQDLERRVIRAIGDPLERFSEDKLRMLRAVRFAAKFDFALEPDTRAALAKMAGQLTVVSAERIAAEMRLILTHASRANAATLLREFGLLALTLPELDANRMAESWAPTLDALNALDSETTFPLALATLLHRFVEYGRVAAIGARWKLSNREIERTAWLLQHRKALEGAAAQPWPRIQRLLIEEGAQELVALHGATSGDKSAAARDVAFCKSKLALDDTTLNPPPLVSGDDLKAHGIPPGKIYQSLLEAVRDAQLDGTISSKVAALTFAAALHKQSTGK